MDILSALERERDGEPVAAFARRLGVHRSTYHRWLTGERGIGAQSQRRIFAVFPGLAVRYLAALSEGVETPQKRTRAH